MKLHILAVSHRQPDWIEAGCAEYLKRMPRELTVKLTEIKPEPRGGKNTQQLMAAESARIRAALPAHVSKIVLDERGRNLDTRQLSDALKGWMQAGQEIAFLIGGADGLDPSLKSEASDALRLSSFTLPHGMARLLLCEQLYRAISLIKNHPYHRE